MPDWKPASLAILPQDFYRELASHADTVLVVHWWAVWNTRNEQRMDDRIQILGPKFADRIVFRSFDVDLPDGFAITRDCRVLNLPALVCFIRGKHFETSIGLGTLDRTEAALNAWVSASDGHAQ